MCKVLKLEKGNKGFVLEAEIPRLGRFFCSTSDEGFLGRGVKREIAVCRRSHSAGWLPFYNNLLVRINSLHKTSINPFQRQCPKDLPASHLAHLLKFLPLLNIATLGTKPLAYDLWGTNHI